MLCSFRMQCRHHGPVAGRWLCHPGSRSHRSMQPSSSLCFQMQETGAAHLLLTPVLYCRYLLTFDLAEDGGFSFKCYSLTCVLVMLGAQRYPIVCGETASSGTEGSRFISWVDLRRFPLPILIPPTAHIIIIIIWGLYSRPNSGQSHPHTTKLKLNYRIECRHLVWHVERPGAFTAIATIVC